MIRLIFMMVMVRMLRKQNHCNNANQKNHSSDNATPIRLRSTFRISCQQGVHQEARITTRWRGIGIGWRYCAIFGNG